ncbi:MAG: hypothetical protein WDN67_04205 [Candidatus Moraniibacteriota bacterium]
MLVISLDAYVWELRQKAGYEQVEIPHITKKDLYEISGHGEKFKDELFRITTREGHEFRHEADELSSPYPDLRPASLELPRIAPALRQFHGLLPRRTDRGSFPDFLVYALSLKTTLMSSVA